MGDLGQKWERQVMLVLSSGARINLVMGEIRAGITDDEIVAEPPFLVLSSPEVHPYQRTGSKIGDFVTFSKYISMLKRKG
jgi:hypothetical protein